MCLRPDSWISGEALRKIGVVARRLETAKPKMLTDMQPAKMLQATVGAHLHALAPPIDEISGSLELGAGTQQRDLRSEAAGWALYSVRITTTL